MKKIVFFAVVAITTIVLTGCNGEANDNEGITLTFWNGFTASDGEILRDIVDGFNASNEHNITIEMDIMPWANFNEQLPPAITSGTAPDFALMIRGDLAQYAENGALRSMDDFWEIESVDRSNFMEASLAMGNIEGTQYSIPMQAQSNYLFWNKDLFIEAGLDPELPPATWDELVEVAAILANPERNVSGFAIPNNHNEILFNWILAHGGRVLNDDFTASEFYSAETLEVLETIQNLIVNEQAGPQAIAESEMFNLMNAGQLGMIITGPWLIPGLETNEINFGVTTLPQQSVSGSQSAILDGVGFVIPVSTDDSKIEAIFEFVSYWNSTEIGSRWTLEAGFPPYLYSVRDSAEVSSNDIAMTLSGQMDFAEPFLTGFSNIGSLNSDIVSPMVERLLQGESPEELLRHADEQINDLLGQ